MDYTHLGRSGLSVSRLCLGTMNFGPLTTEAEGHAIMDAAHEAGVNFFDTANVYGRVKGEGVTAPIVGPRTLAQFHESLRALELSLDDDVLSTLDKLFPGPGGTAPEAYAW